MDPLARECEIVQTVCGLSPQGFDAHVLIEQDPSGPHSRSRFANKASLTIGLDMMDNIDQGDHVELLTRPFFGASDVLECEGRLASALVHAPGHGLRRIYYGSGLVNTNTGYSRTEFCQEKEQISGTATDVQDTRVMGHKSDQNLEWAGIRAQPCLDRSHQRSVCPGQSPQCPCTIADGNLECCRPKRNRALSLRHAAVGRTGERNST